MLRVAGASFKMGDCWSCLFALLSSLLFVITAGFTCDDLTAKAAQTLNMRIDPVSRAALARLGMMALTTPFARMRQRMCLTLDSSFCGTQSSIFHYDDNGNDSKYYFFTHDNGVKVGLRRYVYINLDLCKASITDADGTETPCECNFKNCPDVISLKPVTWGDYESGAFADACMDEAWGVQGGVMLAYSINAGLCVAAADNSTIPPPPPPATAPTGGGSPMFQRQLVWQQRPPVATSCLNRLLLLLFFLSSVLLLSCDD